MLKSYWRAFAYLGVALLCGAIFGFFLGRVEVRDTEVSAENRIERAQDVGKNSYGFFPPWPAASAPVGDPTAYTSEDKTNQRDLVAQEWMAWAAFWMLIVTSLGVYFVAQTLSATQKALLQAGAATKAAEDAVKVTEKFAYFQTRPFLNHHGLTLKIHDARSLPDSKNEAIIAVDLKIRNTGKTPANTQFGSVHLAISPRSFEEHEAHKLVLAEFHTVCKQIAPDFDGDFPCRMSMDWDVLQNAMQTGGVIWVWGQIPYTPIFDSDQTHVMKFSYFVTTGAFNIGIPFDTTAAENEAS